MTVLMSFDNLENLKLKSHW